MPETAYEHDRAVTLIGASILVDRGGFPTPRTRWADEANNRRGTRMSISRAPPSTSRARASAGGELGKGHGTGVLAVEVIERLRAELSQPRIGKSGNTQRLALATGRPPGLSARHPGEMLRECRLGLSPHVVRQRSPQRSARHVRRSLHMDHQAAPVAERP